MPYFGLVDSTGRELKFPSYHRIDWSEVRWGINNRDPRLDDPEVDYCLVNIDPLQWLPQEDWGEVWLAVFRELEDEVSFGGQGPGPFRARARGAMLLRPGRLRMPIRNTGWQRRRDPEPVPQRSGWWPKRELGTE